MFEQIQWVPWGLICLCLSGSLCMTFVMGGISRGGSWQQFTLVFFPGKSLKVGVPDHLTCLLRNLYVDQEATVRTGHGTTEWFKIGKGVGHIVYCHHVYLTSISAGSHHGRCHPWQRSCGRDLTGKGRSGLKGPPESARAPTPKPKSVLLFCASHQLFWH